MMDRPLTNRQKCFVEHYVACLSADEAARRAGYSLANASTIGNEILRKSKRVQAALAEVGVVTLEGPSYQTVREVCQVWAALTRNPQITYRELSRISGLPLARTRAAIGRLQGLGYIERVARQARAIRVLVPFVEVPHGD